MARYSMRRFYFSRESLSTAEKRDAAEKGPGARVMADHAVAFPDVNRLRRLSYSGRQIFQGDQPSIEESSTTKSLKNASPDEHSDDGCKSFAGIVELEAALLEILELVGTL